MALGQAKKNTFARNPRSQTTTPDAGNPQPLTWRAGAEGTAVTFCAPDERSLLRDIEKMLKVAITVEKAPEGTYVDALADPDGDFAPLNKTQRPRQGARPQGAKPQGAKPQGQGRRPDQRQAQGGRPGQGAGKPGQGRAPADGQQAGKPAGNRHHPAAAGPNQNGDQPAKPRRSRRGGDRRPRPEQAGDKAVARG